VFCMADCLNTSGDVDVAQNNAAKNGPVSISVPRHHRQPYRGISYDFIAHNYPYEITNSG
jgi:hypothetical protein